MHKGKIMAAFSFMTILLLMLSLTSASAAHSGKYENINWTLDDSGLLTISGNGDMPDMANDDAWGTYKDDIKEVVIKTGVTSIGYSAFSHCGNMLSITMPNSIEKIEADAFEYSGITSITIPSGCKVLGGDAFYECSSLEKVSLPEGLGSIEDSTFGGCYKLKDINLPESLTKIGDYAFDGCGRLREVIIPGKVKSIGKRAFDSCIRMTNVTISEGVQSIGEGAFYGCDGIRSITIPQSVTSIGDNAFDGQIQHVMILAKKTQFPDSLFFFFDTELEDPVIYCYKDSDAQAYAEDWEIKTVFLDGKDIDDFASVTSQEKMTINCRDDIQVEYDYFPKTGNQPVWKSSNTSVVKVSDKGVLTPVKPGKATITLSVNGISSKTEVKVAPKAEQLIIPDPIYIPRIGDTKIPVQYVPSDAIGEITGEVTDTDYAEIPNIGKLRGKKCGNTTVTIIDTISGLKKKVGLHVVSSVDSVSFLESTYYVTKGSSVQVKAKITTKEESFYNQLVEFSTYDKSIISVDPESGIVTGLSNGKATVEANSKDKSAMCTIYVSDSMIVIPAETKTIDAEAFYGTSSDEYFIPEGAKSIKSQAFGNLKKQRVRIHIPASVSSIADDAFSGSNVVLVVPSDCYAESWAWENGIEVDYE